jgi:hypothetical protein
MIFGDTYWMQHMWTNVHLSGKKRLVDIMDNPATKAGIAVQYVSVLKDKWRSVVETDEQQLDRDKITDLMKIYRQSGYNAALKHVRDNRCKEFDEAWIKIFDEASHLKTFKSIKKYEYMLFV